MGKDYKTAEEELIYTLTNYRVSKDTAKRLITEFREQCYDEVIKMYNAMWLF